MSRFKPIILILFILGSAFTAGAQTGNDGKSNDMSSFFGFDGLRLNNPELLYNERFLADSTYIFEKSDLNGDFQSVKKILLHYDNQGRLVNENEFENKEGDWKKSLTRTYNYNADGFVDYRVNREWNVFEQEFENSQRTFFYRNYMGNVSREIVESHESDSWNFDLKREYVYNDQNKIAEELSFDWSIETLQWQPEKRKLYEYNGNKDLISEIYQVWVDTLARWVNTSLKNYEYNDDRQLINLSQKTWSPNLEKWIDHSFQALSYTALGQIQVASSYEAIDSEGALDASESVEATYDENGNLSTTLFREWNEDQNAWSSFEKHVHFWSEYLIGNLDYTDENIECFYANPHTVGLPWYCNSLLKNETYHLSIFDHNGVLHHTQIFKGSDTFRLTKNLDNGLYMVVITGSLTVHTEKVIIKN